MRKRDLAKARDDLAAFARLADAELTRWQAAALRLDARTTYVLGPRQSGKSRGAALVALHTAFRRPDQFVLVVSASELGAKRLLALAAQLAASSPILSASVVDEQTGLLVLSNGSQIRSVAASERSIRGWTADLLILDEATELADGIIDAASPVTAARPEAKVLYLSTAGAPVGRAYEAYMAGLDGRSDLIRSFTWALKDARWITKSAIEHERLTMPPWRFAAEYEGRWAGAADALFPADLLQAASADFELPDLASLAGPARVLGGVDWGASHDRSAVCGIARIPCKSSVPVFVCWPARVFPVGHPLAACVDEVVRSAARWSVLSYETNGIGEGPSQDLFARMVALREAEERDWITRRGDLAGFDGPVGAYNPTVTTWASKAECLGQMRTLAERGQLVFQRQPEFMRELASVRVEHRAQSVGIEAPAGRHDDLVMAAAIASCSYRRQPSGELRCHLGHLARTDHRAAQVPDLGGPTVEVGGIELPKAPWLQSVSGTEVTPPVGHDPDQVNPYIAEARRVLAAARERTP